MTPEEELKLNKKSVTTTQSPDIKQEIVQNDYVPQYDKFEYKADNPSYLSIMQQARQHRNQIEDREQRAQRVAKFSAWSDFANSLMQLAGGGYSNPTFKPSPYLTKAFAEIDRARTDKEEADRYYSALGSKLRSEDYNTQLKYHNAMQVEKNKYGFQAGQKKADAQNAQNLAIARNNTTKTSEEFLDPTKQNKELELRERQVNIQQQNANANTVRANKATTAEKKAEDAKKTLITINHADGSKTSVTKTQAKELVKLVQKGDAFSMILKTQGTTPEEKKFLNDVTLASANDNSLAAAVMYILKNDKTGQYSGFRSKIPVQKKSQSLLPSLQGSQTNNNQPRRKSLLP